MSAGGLNVMRLVGFISVNVCLFLCLSEHRRERTRLEQLQREQKIMEERNKRTKALLAKTIAEK